jgi:hypothetical protein
MKKSFLIVLLLASFSLAALAQQRKDLLLSVGVGPLAQHPTGLAQYTGRNLGVSLTADYFFAARHILSFNVVSGKYFQEVERPAGTLGAGLADQHQLMFVTTLYKYRLVNSPRFTVTAGAGLSMVAARRNEHQWRVDPVGGIGYNRIEETGGIGFAGAAKLEVGYRLGTRWSVGLEAGFITALPWSPVVDGTHLMPRVSYLLQ